MKRFGKYAIGALMLAGSALGVTLATTAPADAHVSVGIGFGPAYYGGYYGPGYYGDYCVDPRYRYYHPEVCDYYYDGYYGPAYYGPGFGDGFFFFDSFGHRHFHHGFDHDHWGGGHWGGGHWGGGHGEGGGHWGGHHH